MKRPFTILLLLGAALSFFALIVNHRRAAELSLMAGLAVIMLLAIRFEDEHRSRWLGLSLMAILAVTVFTVASWDHQGGFSAELVRPIRSQFQPDQRDYLSNIYRISEDADIQFTFRTSPLFGIGFGIPMAAIFPMADISKIYPLWNYIPHNTLLWLGMRMGAIGYAAFFGLVAMAVLQACRQLASRRDPLLNAFAAFAVAAIAAEIVQGYSDLQLDTYRNLIVFGILLGLLNRLPKLADA
jgi:O-antigen ligase